MKFSASVALLSVASCLSLPWASDAWTTTTLHTTGWASSKSAASSSSTVLFNVPPPSTEDAVAFKDYADKQAPPASFFELQQDSIKAAKVALKDGYKLLEIEFPPLPANVLEMDDVSAYDVAQANLKLAIEFAKGFSADKNAAILFPDESESKIAIEKLTGNEDAKPTTEVEAGITISSLRRSEEGDDRILKVCKRIRYVAY